MRTPLHSIRYDLRRARDYPVRAVGVMRPSIVVIEFESGTISYIWLESYDIAVSWLKRLTWIQDKAQAIRIDL